MWKREKDIIDHANKVHYHQSSLALGSSQSLYHSQRHQRHHNHQWRQMKPAKLVVVPGACLGQFKVHLLGEH